MHLSFATLHNPFEIHHWSGTPYFLAKALLQQSHTLDYIYNFKAKKGTLHSFMELTGKLTGRFFQSYRTDYYIKQLGKELQTRIKDHTDCIFSPTSLFFPFLHSDKPKVFYTDATFAGMLGFYESYSKFSKSFIKSANDLEKQAIANCELAIYSSDWAARSAIEYYNADSRKVKVVPFGANIESELSFQEVSTAISNRKHDSCHLLFCGVDWQRKGGKIALECAKTLNYRGLKTYLHVVGLNEIPEPNLPDFVINHGFLSKNNPMENQRFKKLFLGSNFLIVPSFAEAYGLVYSEASSFGLPSLAFNIGGVSAVVKNRINGFLFPIEATGKDFADFIENSTSDQKNYNKLCISSYDEFKNRLNWKVAGKAIIDLITEVVQ